MRGAGHERDRVGRESLRDEGFAHDVDQRDVGGVGRRRAAQQCDVAALERERRGVDGHVGSRLVDHPDDADGHADLPHLEPVGEGVAAHHLADGVRQRGDVAHGVGDRAEAFGREGQPVDDGGIGAGLDGAGDVARVDRDDVGGGGVERVRDRVQRRVLAAAVQTAQHHRGVAAAARDVEDRVPVDVDLLADRVA